MRNPEAWKWVRAALLVVISAGIQPSLAKSSGPREASELRDLVIAEYETRELEPRWTDRGGLSERGEEALIALMRAELQGAVQPGLHRFVRRVKATDAAAAEDWARHEIEITRRLLQLGLRLRGLDRSMFRSADLAPEYQRPDTARLLKDVLTTDSPLQLLDRWQPPAPGFKALSAQLNRYQEIAASGGWPQLHGSGVLEPGDSSPEVATLRARLAVEGFSVAAPAPKAEGRQAAGRTDEGKTDNATAAADSGEMLFDEALSDAIRAYQNSRGLEPDGLLGPNTRASLNITPAQRIQQIQLNLARRRALPHDLGDHYIWVNLPEYELRVFKNDKIRFRSPVVIGKRQHETPVFIDHIEYLVVNPYWNVPQSIAVNELLPAQVKDPGYLDRKRMEVLDGWSENASPIAPDSVDWTAHVGARALPFRIRQRPGNGNALGRVKFIFPNNFSVYLHDTPSDHLFSETRRSFSHGCIRVGKPFELADYVLENQKDSPVDFKQLLDSEENQRVNLDRPLPVYLVYFTAWVGEEGEMQFRDDLYGHDRQLAAVLDKQTSELRAEKLLVAVRDAKAKEREDNLLARLSRRFLGK